MSQVAPVSLLIFTVLITTVFSGRDNRTNTSMEFDSSDSALEQDIMFKSGRAININDPISFLLYDTRNATWVRMAIDKDVPSDMWNFGGQIKLLLHGYNGRVNRNPMKVMESMLIVGREYAKKNASLNIVAVDWTPLASRPILQYSEAAKKVQEAGIAVAQYLMGLRKQRALTRWTRLHMIGFSLGAHVAGIAGQEIQKLTGGRKVGRITGLDPAGPDFDKADHQVPVDSSGVLDKSDARYVDIIHCNMGAPPGNVIVAALIGKFGSSVQAGHADFYPNGGERQEFQCDEIQDRTGCSHNMCVLYYALSITKELPGCPCRSWSYFMGGLCSCWTGDKGFAEYMGDLSNRRGTARGKYFLVVTNKVSVKYFTK